MAEHKQMWRPKRGNRTKHGVSYHEEVIGFILKRMNGHAKSARELYRAYVEETKGHLSRDRFSMILSDETLRVAHAPRIERVMHGVYRKAGEKTGEQKFSEEREFPNKGVWRRREKDVTAAETFAKAVVGVIKKMGRPALVSEIKAGLDSQFADIINDSEFYTYLSEAVKLRRLVRRGRGIYAAPGMEKLEVTFAANAAEKLPKKIIRASARGPHKRKASFYTPEELLAYAKKNGLTEADIAESIDMRRVNVRINGPGSDFDEL